jgi:hypothetical protein
MDIDKLFDEMDEGIVDDLGFEEDEPETRSTTAVGGATLSLLGHNPIQSHYEQQQQQHHRHEHLSDPQGPSDGLEKVLKGSGDVISGQDSIDGLSNGDSFIGSPKLNSQMLLWSGGCLGDYYDDMFAFDFGKCSSFRASTSPGGPACRPSLELMVMYVWQF